LLRQAEVELAQGRTVGEICRGIEVSETTFYRWRAEYGGLKVDQVRWLKHLEAKNARLKRAVAGEASASVQACGLGSGRGAACPGGVDRSVEAAQAAVHHHPT
jgi:transposase-like protein